MPFGNVNSQLSHASKPVVAAQPSHRRVGTLQSPPSSDSEKLANYAALNMGDSPEGKENRSGDRHKQEVGIMVVNIVRCAHGGGYTDDLGGQLALHSRHIPGSCQRGTDPRLDLACNRGVLLEACLGAGATLAETCFAEGDTRPGFREDAMLQPQVHHAARGGDAFAVLDVELRLAKGSSELVLDHLRAHAVADRLAAGFERLDATEIDALSGVELQRRPPGCVSRGP